MTAPVGGYPGNVQSLKVLNEQISWKDGEIHWEADPHHVEILARQLGMQDSTPVKTKTPGDKNDADKTFRFRDLDGEDEHQSEETVCYVDELFRQASASPGRVPASLLKG